MNSTPATNLCARLTAVLVACLLCGVALVARAAEVHITILHTTDLHGNILPTTDYQGNPNRGGIARLATKIADIRRENPNTLLVDAGDTIQGTTVSFNSEGRLIVKLLNHLKYDAWTLGNHEFDWGLKKIARCITDAEVPVLGANIKLPVERDGEPLPPEVAAFKKVRPFIIKEINGVKVGIIGLTTPGIPNWSRPRLIQPLEFVDSVRTLARVVPEVQRQGAQILVLVTHQGYKRAPDDHANQIHSIAANFPELDVIIGGHSHQEWSELLIRPSGILYTQANYWGTHLGRVDIKFDTAKNKIVEKSSKTILMDESVPLDPAIVDLCKDDLAAAQKELKTVIGEAQGDFITRGAPKRETHIHNLICDAIDAALQKQNVRADAIIHGVLNDKGILKKGPVTVQDAWTVVPYENTIGVFEVSLDTFKQLLAENALHFERGSFRGVWGVRITYQLSEERGKPLRIVSIADRDGKPFPPDAKIKVAANSFDLASGGTRFPKLREIADRPESKLVEYDFQTRQALIDFIKEKQKLAPRILGWWNFLRGDKPAPQQNENAPAPDSGALPRETLPATPFDLTAPTAIIPASEPDEHVLTR
jgi:2',3'-cyclic-nucleotide 2'-phosphodiesterase/3'-nucleotidase